MKKTKHNLLWTMYSDFGIEKSFAAFVETKTIFYQNRRLELMNKKKKDQKLIHCISFLGAKLPLHQFKCRAFP